MTNERPNEPETSQLATDRHNRGFPPKTDNPSRVREGLSSATEIESFPRAAVEGLRRDLRAMDELDVRAVSPSDLRAVLSWIDRYVPGRVAMRGEELEEVGGIMILSLDSDADLDRVDMIRVNGRPFVPEPEAKAETSLERLHSIDRKSLRDWLEEDRESCLEDDPSVGIFASESMADAFSELISIVEDSGPIPAPAEVLIPDHPPCKVLAEADPRYGGADAEFPIEPSRFINRDAAASFEEDHGVGPSRSSVKRSHRAEGRNFVD